MPVVESDEELPSLEADVPSFPPAGEDAASLAEPISVEGPPANIAPAEAVGEWTVIGIQLDDSLLTDEDLSLIEWSEAGTGLQEDSTATTGDRVLPDWLSVPEPVFEEVQTETVSEPTAQIPPLPDWLELPEEAAPAVEPSSTLSTPPSPELELPAWLDLAEPLPSPPPTQGDIDRTLPDWLTALEPGEANRTMQDGLRDELPGVVERKLPDWLSETERSEAERVLPDWLTAAESATAEVSLPDRQAESEDEEEAAAEPLPPSLPSEEPAPQPTAALPEWLSLEEPKPITEPPEPAHHELPDWLELAEAQPVDLRSKTDLPDWLDLDEPQDRIDRGLPDWLDMDESTLETAKDLPDWLDLDEPTIETAKELPDWLDLAEPPARAAKDLPTWLSLSEPAESTEETGGPFSGPPPQAVKEIPSEPAVLPGWLFAEEGKKAEPVSALPERLITPEPAKEEIESQAPEVQTADESAASGGETTAPVIEEQVQPAEEAHHPDKTPPQSILETRNKDLGDDPVSPSNIALARPRRTPSTPTRKHIEPASTPDYTAVFSEILQPQTERQIAAVALPAPRQPRLIYFLLIIVVLFPLLFPGWINITAKPETSNVFSTVDALAPDANVLVSFDWTAGNDDEMAPIADAVVAHLAKKKVKIVAVSLVPEGAKFADRAIKRDVLSKAKGYVEGERVVNMGYLPGDEAAIQSLSANLAKSYVVDYTGTPVKDLPILSGVKGIKSFDLVVVLAAEPETLKKWITQLSARYPDRPIVAGIGAMALPWAKPFAATDYLGQASQLKGTVAGIRGAAEYELLSNDPNDNKPRLALSTLDAQSLGAVFIVLVIVFGNLAHLRNRRNSVPPSAADVGWLRSRQWTLRR